MLSLPAIVRLLAAVMLSHAAAAAHAQAVPEHELKAAFIFNFAMFAEWPADAAQEGGEFPVCVDPASPLRLPLAGIEGKIIKGYRLKLRSPGAAESLRACRVLVISAGDRERWPQMRKAIEGASVLTVAEDDAGVREGIVITLAREGQRLAFDIDLRAARQARLVLSSKLLRLARTAN